jgi:very-short-patch-repair endonuclease
MSDFVVPLIVVLVVILIIAASLNAVIGDRTLPVRARRLMTERERETISLIEAAVPNCRVHAQVAMAALVDCNKGLSPKQRASVRNRFDRKIIDFVLEDRSTGGVLALVELDDRSHDERRDRARDQITIAAGYRTIRLPAGKRPDRMSVRDRILAGLAEQPKLSVS